MAIKLKKIEPEKMEMGMEMKGMRFLPTLYLDSKQVPEIADWKVGEEYMLVLKVKQTSKSENDKEKDGKVNSVRAEFDILAYKAGEDEDYENMTDKEIEDIQGRL